MSNSKKDSSFFNKPVEKEFHLSDVLSTITGKFVSVNGLDGMYSVPSFMADIPVMSGCAGTLMLAVKPYILDQHPELIDVSGEGIDGENVDVWVKEQVEKFGATISLKQPSKTSICTMHEQWHQITMEEFGFSSSSILDGKM